MIVPRPPLLVVMAFAASALACSPKKSSGSKQGGGEAPVSPATPGGDKPCGASLQGGLPPPKPDKGQIVFALTQQNVDPCSVTGYVVGAPDGLVVQHAGGGVYYVPDAPVGASDLIIQAREVPPASVHEGTRAPTDVAGANVSAPAAETARLGIRVNRVVTVAGQDTTLSRSTTLLPVGLLTGFARLEGQATHPGILVNVPGTRYAAFTAADGRYVLDEVVPGEHDMSFSHDQYLPYRLGVLVVDPARQTFVPDVLLRLNRGAVGPILLDDADVVTTLTDGTPVSRDLSFAFTLVPTGTPVKMKVSHQTGCPNVEYGPFATRGSYAVPVTDALRRTGVDDVTLHVCLVDKDNTASNLSLRIRVSVFGDAKPTLSVPVRLDAGYERLPVIVSYSQPLPEGVALDLFTSGASLSERTEAAETPASYGLVANAPEGRTLLPLAHAPRCGRVAVVGRLRAALADAGTIVGPPVVATSERMCIRDVRPLDRPDFFLPFAAAARPFWLGDRLALWGDDAPTFEGSRAYNHIYDPLAGLWTEMSEPEPPKRDFGGTTSTVNDYVAESDGRRLLIAGPDATKPGGVYDAKTGVWTVVPKLAGPLDPKIHLWLGDRFFAWDHTANGAAVYLPESAAWLPVSKEGMPQNRLEPTVVWTGKRLVVVGGLFTPAPNAMYDPLEDTWTTLATAGAPSPRDGAYGVHIAGKVYVFGGYHIDPFTSAFLELENGAVFDAEANTWSAMATMPPLETPPTYVGAIGGRIVVWGAKNVSHLVYDPATNAWRWHDPPQCPEVVSPVFEFLADRVVQWPPRCGVHEFFPATGAWAGFGIDGPRFADGIPKAFIGRAGSRFFVYELATNWPQASRTPAFFGAAGGAPVELAWLRPEGRAASTVTAGETFGIAYRALNAEVPTLAGSVTIKAVRGPATVVTASAALPALAANASLDVPGAESVRLFVNPGASAGVIEVDLEYATGEGYAGQATASFQVSRAALVVEGLYEQPDLGPGETKTLRLRVGNHGSIALASATVTTRVGSCLSAADGFTVGALAPGEVIEKTIAVTAGAGCALAATARLDGFDVTYADAFGSGRVALARGLAFVLGRYTRVVEESPNLTLLDGTTTDRFLAVTGSGTVHSALVEVEVTGAIATTTLLVDVVSPTSSHTGSKTYATAAGHRTVQYLAYPAVAGASVNGTWTVRFDNDSNTANPVLKRVKLTIEGQR